MPSDIPPISAEAVINQLGAPVANFPWGRRAKTVTVVCQLIIPAVGGIVLALSVRAYLRADANEGTPAMAGVLTGSFLILAGLISLAMSVRGFAASSVVVLQGGVYIVFCTECEIIAWNSIERIRETTDGGDPVGESIVGTKQIDLVLKNGVTRRFGKRDLQLFDSFVSLLFVTAGQNEIPWESLAEPT